MNYSLTTIPAVGTVIMRTDHSIASAEAGYFLDGEIAKGNVIWEGNLGEKWMQTVSIDGVPKICWIPVIRGSKTYTNLKEEIVIPPSGTLPIIHQHAEGYPDNTWTPL